MNTGLCYRAMNEADVPRVCALISQAFGTTLEQAERWVVPANKERFRVVQRPGEVPCGTLLLAEIGQFFGGRAVSMDGVAGVAVAPEARGGGVAAFMMRECLRESRSRGAALSTLYPATQALYRKVGYEHAGFSLEIRIDASSIGTTKEDRALPIRPVRAEDWPRIEAAYRAALTHMNGALERRTYIWDRVRVWRGEKAESWVIDAEGRIEGTVSLMMRPDPSDHTGRKEVFCTDVSAFTGRGARRLLAFLADYSSMATDIIIFAGPAEPLLLLLPEQRWCNATKSELWMTRLVNVEQALRERGYPAGLNARLAFDVEDDDIAENRGLFTLEVAEGRGAVSPGCAPGTPVIRAHVRDLAPIYSGLHPPTVLARLGKIRGPEDALALAGAAFAAPTPAMTDRF